MTPERSGTGDTPGAAEADASRAGSGAGTVGLVLFAHGARDPRWADTILSIASRIASLAPELPVECAYLEMMTPDLAEAVARLAARGGVRTVVIVPVFLSAGGHVLRDLPARLAALEPRHPELHFSVAAAVGTLPSVIDAIAHAGIDAASK
jgi:sirohydrochlorin cobaltochelatase